MTKTNSWHIPENVPDEDIEILAESVMLQAGAESWNLHDLFQAHNDHAWNCECRECQNGSNIPFARTVVRLVINALRECMMKTEKD